MLLDFDFATAQRILFGAGRSATLGTEAARLGRRALVVTGKNTERVAALLASLRQAGLSIEFVSLDSEPDLPRARAARDTALRAKVDLVIGIGGGSVLDLAKAVAALTTNPGDPLDYLEVVGGGQKLGHASLPCIAVPTTAGTGSEVTRNAVLLSPEHRVKASLRSASMLPTLALVDPQLCLGLPAALTAATGLDAFTQVLEPFVSHAANPISDAFAREGLVRGARALRRAFHHPDELDARSDMSLTSLFGGLALANAKLGAVHGLAAPIGGLFDAPHGAVCATLLPLVCAFNLRALRRRSPHAAALSRYQELARLVGVPDADELLRWLRELVDELHIPSLGAYGIGPEHLPTLVELGRQASSMKGNPIELEQQELHDLLLQALG